MRRRRGLHAAGGHGARVAPARRYGHGARAPSTSWTCSTSWAWRRCATWCPSRPQPRLRGPRPPGAAPAPQRRPQGAGRCRRPGRAAHRLSPGLRAGAAHQRRRAHRRLRARRAAAGARRRDRGGAHRRAARQAQPRAQGDRDANARGGDAAGRHRLEAHPDTPHPDRRLRGLPQGRGGPGGEPAGGALPSPRLRHRLGRARPRHRLAALHCRRRHRRRGAGGGGGRASRQGRRPYHGRRPVGAARPPRGARRVPARAPRRQHPRGTRGTRAQHRRLADARQCHRRADGADRARRPVRPGQPASRASPSRPSA